MRLLVNVKVQARRHLIMVRCCLEKPGFLLRVEQETRFLFRWVRPKLVV